MPKITQIKVMAIPYKTLKEKIKITKKLNSKYRMQDLGGVIYAEVKEQHEI